MQGKNRPIIVKLSSFNDKEKILSLGPKLKGTNLAICEDFPVPVRLAHGKLVRYANEQGTPYKL